MPQAILATTINKTEEIQPECIAKMSLEISKLTFIKVFTLNKHTNISLM